MINLKDTNRRTFIKTAAGAAGVALLGGFGCDDDHTNGVVDASTESDDAGQPLVSRQGTPLFSEARIGSLRLKNRLIRAATDDFYSQNGRPTAKHDQLMVSLASGGAGMVISGMAGVWRPEAPPFIPHAFDDWYIPGLAAVREAMGAANGDCKVVAQIGHTGNRYWPLNSPRTGPSDIPWPIDFKTTMQPLTVAMIEEIVAAFAQAARRFKEAGWDGVELHGAHAYLLSSFLSPYTNKRDDQYGGSVARRVRIVSEIVEQSRELVGSDFPILVKINSEDSPLGAFGSNMQIQTVEFEGGIDRELFLETAHELNKLEIDAIEVSGNYCSQRFDDVKVAPYFKDAAAALDVDIPVILTGGNRGAEDIDGILSAGGADFIGVSRPLIREPDLPNKWLRGEPPYAACISCNLCVKNMFFGVRCHQLPKS